MRKAALILDPLWRQQTTHPAQDQYITHLKQQLAQLPPIDFLLTALNKQDELFLPTLFFDPTPGQTYHGSYNMIRSPHFRNPDSQRPSRWGRRSWRNHKILSYKLGEYGKSTKKSFIPPHWQFANTTTGVVNLNAGYDATQRMLNQTKHKIDQIIIIDPHNNIAQHKLMTPWSHSTELAAAWVYAVANSQIACAVIV